MRQFDLILFGASGFTGKHCIEEIVKSLEGGRLERRFSWAVAGRSLDSLRAALQEMSALTGVNLDSVQLIRADVDDEGSLRQMAAQCQVLLNTVGPYALYGEAVIRACIQEGTHHVDISAESQDLTLMQLRWGEEAERAGVYVIGSCGFDSIPIECGINFLQQHFKGNQGPSLTEAAAGELNSVDSYLYTGSHLRNNKVNYGTWDSIVGLFAGYRQLLHSLQTLNPEPLPPPEHKVRWKWLHWNHAGGESGSCVPFPHPDIWAVQRTQHYMYSRSGTRPIQFHSYLKQSNLFLTLLIAIGGLFIGLLTQCASGVYLLRKFPGFFSAGLISHTGPTRAQMERFTFSQTLIGEGWDEGSPTNERPTKRLSVKVEGVNPAYGATCTCLLQAALTILEEKEQLPPRGGVFTPGIAFESTTIAERLTKHGLTFTLIPCQGEK